MAEIHSTEGSQMVKTIQEQGKIVTVPVGISMWPMLKNRKDHIVIVAVDRPLRKYDIPMYRRSATHFVLHRIIKIRKDGGYVICGDNLWRKEYHVKDEDIVGVLAGFFKGNHYIDCEKNRWYHAYVYIWRFLYPIRCCFLITKEYSRRLFKKIKKSRNPN